MRLEQTAFDLRATLQDFEKFHRRAREAARQRNEAGGGPESSLGSALGSRAADGEEPGGGSRAQLPPAVDMGLKEGQKITIALKGTGTMSRRQRATEAAAQQGAPAPLVPPPTAPCRPLRPPALLPPAPVGGGAATAVAGSRAPNAAVGSAVGRVASVIPAATPTVNPAVEGQLREALASGDHARARALLEAAAGEAAGEAEGDAVAAASVPGCSGGEQIEELDDWGDFASG